MGLENASLLGSIFHLDISVDLEDPEHYAIQISQPALGLPDRGYYLDAGYANQRTDYKIYITKLLELANWPEADDRAKEIVQFETSTAEVVMPTPIQGSVRIAEVNALKVGISWS